ncbi:MAG TPA: hypothetical protein VMW66_00580 [Elusimicrobiales bacterium]|nr:hypothetical protein [Elusimicrobiales bacterium]
MKEHNLKDVPVEELKSIFKGKEIKMFTTFDIEGNPLNSMLEYSGTTRIFTGKDYQGLKKQMS